MNVIGEDPTLIVVEIEPSQVPKQLSSTTTKSASTAGGLSIKLNEVSTEQVVPSFPV